ncbi:MAG: hypothetical protein M1819_002443 [Sarea resinae]|nr:MAG: hypothetical protein M1819_002443 [Sarea resinae]
MGSRLEANSNAVRKRIETHNFEDEEGEEYEASKFGGFTDYFRRKKIKLQNLDAELRSSSSNPQIFRGIVAHVNGYTQPSLNDLHNLIVSHGGGFMQYLDGKTAVTHIIASNLTPKKRVEFRNYRIVKPAWVVESVKAGRLLPWNGFRALDEGPGQKVLGFENGKVITQSNHQQTGYADQTSTSWYTDQVRDVVRDLGSRSGTPMELIDEIQIDRGLELPPSHQPGLDEEPQTSNDSLLGPGEPSRRSVSGSSNMNDQEKHQDPAPTGPFMGRNTNAIRRSESFDVDERVSLSEDNVPPSTPPITQPKQSLLADAASKQRKLTPEEHNALLLADPRIWKSTVVNPGFLQQYYQESRLHHLSSWKADLKSQLQSLTAEKTSSQKASEKRIPGARRYIMHVDFDSFFVAVSMKNAPQHKDRPAVVAHGGGPGSEIASCNYPARKFGIKNGMWMKHAQSLCPELKVLPYDFKGYEDASRAFYDAILATGGIVQSVSVDEALVDITALCLPAGGSEGKGVHEGSIWREQAKADEIAQDLRDKVKERTGCAVSVGLGANILLAKVALRRAKPAGQYQIKPEEVLNFLGSLTVQELPGVAYSIGGKLEEIGVKFVKDIRDLSRERLISALGPKTGEKIWDFSRGIDRTEVGEQVVRKSISAEVNWGVRFETQAQAEEFVDNLCGELHRRLVNQKVKGRQLTVKIMRRAADAPLDPPKHLGHGKCDVANKSLVLGIATNAQDILSKEAISILRGYGFSPGDLRGIGVQMTRLEPLKGTLGGGIESSQKRLHFKTVGSPNPVKNEAEDPIFDDVESPQKPGAGRSRPEMAVVSKMAESGCQTPLNTLGTQFILPSQFDPKVVAELPDDIRSRFLRVEKTEPKPSSRTASPSVKSRSHSPSNRHDILPIPSQLDQETLDALPEDVRAEVLAFYQRSPRKHPGQSLLPQSPRKVRSITASSKKTVTPTKRRTGLLFQNRQPVKGDSSSTTLTQSNFVAHRSKTADPSAVAKSDFSDSEEIPADFLEALPEDIRREVLAEHRRSRLKMRSGLDISNTKKKRLPAVPPIQAGQRQLRLQPRPPKPTFTVRKLSSLPELREAVLAWHDEFKGDPPYEEDVQALVRYLGKVVSDEGDLDKAVAVAKWMAWVLDQEGDGGEDEADEVRRKWRDALRAVEEGIQEAVRARGLGRVHF